MFVADRAAEVHRRNIRDIQQLARTFPTGIHQVRPTIEQMGHSLNNMVKTTLKLIHAASP